MYFYKAFFKDGEVDYIVTNFAARRPKSIDSTCIRLEHISFFHYIIAKIFHPNS